jgi:hypothetical protein
MRKIQILKIQIIVKKLSDIDINENVKVFSDAY